MLYFNLILLILLQLVAARRIGYSSLKIDHKFEDQAVTSANFKIAPTLLTWDTLETPKKFSLTSMVVEHHSDGSWYLQSYHEKYSIGWNRTTRNQFMTRPFACNIRFVGVGLEATMTDFLHGGTGYLTMSFSNDKKMIYHGFDKNETNRLHCYYSTNKETGSNFLDNPHTVGVAVYCPVILDDESGAFIFKHIMKPGDYCRVLADNAADVEIHLRPSDFTEATTPDEGKEITSEVRTVPVGARQRQIRELMRLDYRPHAVCTVQTFCNPQSGSMLYLFVSYYQIMGWRVIVYDRFGMHYEYLKDLINLPGVDYYPFTMYQLAQPTKYSEDFKKTHKCERLTFYKDEVRRGKYNSKKLADTADQDADKTRTYDLARMEYNHLDTLLYVDADELFYCPQYPNSTEAQRKYQQSLMTDFQLRGVEEMRFVRVPYSGLAPPGFEGNRSEVDFTQNIEECMNNGFKQKNLVKMLQCWSSGSSFDKFTKSADLAGVCPFHYNHWSCDGMRGGGRDHTPKICRCKVALDMQNWFQFRPILDRCHLVHLHDNKYRMESKLAERAHDRGDITKYSPLVRLMESYKPPQ